MLVLMVSNPVKQLHGWKYCSEVHALKKIDSTSNNENPCLTQNAACHLSCRGQSQRWLAASTHFPDDEPMQGLDGFGAIQTVGVSVAQFTCRKKPFFISCKDVIATQSAWIRLCGISHHTIIPSSKWPHGAAILCHSDGVGAATGHVSHSTDVLHQCGHIPTLAVAVACRGKMESRLFTGGDIFTELLRENHI